MPKGAIELGVIIVRHLETRGVRQTNKCLDEVVRTWRVRHLKEGVKTWKEKENHVWGPPQEA